MHTRQTADRHYGKVSHDRQAQAGRDFVYKEAMKRIDKIDRELKEAGDEPGPSSGQPHTTTTEDEPGPSCSQKQPQSGEDQSASSSRQQKRRLAADDQPGTSSGQKRPHTTGNTDISPRQRHSEMPGVCQKPADGDLPALESIVAWLAPESTDDSPQAFFGVVHHYKKEPPLEEGEPHVNFVRVSRLSVDLEYGVEGAAAYRMELGQSVWIKASDLVYPVDYRRGKRARFIIYTTPGDVHDYVKARHV